MFRALFFKEWKDKAHLFLFGVTIEVLVVLVSLGMSNKEGLRDVLHGALLVIYFPFIALLLGSSAFEREFRSDAWAFLFSRPIKKSSIWAVKFSALFSLLGILWGIFLGTVEAMVGIKVLTKGFEFPLGAGAEFNLLQLGVLASLTFFVVSFSISFLSERSSSTLFAALIIGIGFGYGLIAAYLGGLRPLQPELTNPRVAVMAYRWGPFLLNAAFAVASLLTFVRADFCQPRKKIVLFAKRSGLFLGAAVVLLGLWMIFLPGIREKRVWIVGASGTDIFYSTDKGLSKYDSARDRYVDLVKSKTSFYVAGVNAIRNGMLYLHLERVDKQMKSWIREGWTMSSDGTKKRQILMEKIPGLDDERWFRACLSPDGNRIVLSRTFKLGGYNDEKSPLWIINTDGSGLRELPLESSLRGEFRDVMKPGASVGRGRFALNLLAWPEGTNFIVFRLWTPGWFSVNLRTTKLSRLFLYDLETGTSRLLFEGASLSADAAASPSQKRLAFIYRSAVDTENRLAVIDLDTLEIMDVYRGDIKDPWIHSEVIFRLRWNPEGDRLAFLLQRKSPQTGRFEHALIVYSAAERRVMSEKVLDGADAGTTSFAWLSDGRSIVVNNRSDNALSILSPSLDIEKKIAFPTSAQNPVGVNVVGDKILVVDAASDDLWRYDLGTEKWECIY